MKIIRDNETKPFITLLMVSGLYQDLTITLNCSSSESSKSNIFSNHTPLTPSRSVPEPPQEMRSTSLPFFSPLLFSCLPCVKLHSTYQFTHSHTQTFSSLAPYSCHTCPINPTSYRHLSGCPGYTNSKHCPQLNSSTLSQDLLLLPHLTSQGMTSRFTQLAQPRNPRVTLDSTLTPKLSHQSLEPVKKTNQQKNRGSRQCTEFR